MAPKDRAKLHRAVVAIVLIAAVGLAGCGRRGPLEAPVAATAAQPAPAGSTAPADTGPAKPDKPFVLDPLL